MNERDFKDALRQTMTAQPAPPPMSDTEVLDAARRDRKRRRALWAGGGSAAAVVAIAVGVAVLAPSAGGGTTRVGGQPEDVTATADVPTQSDAPEQTGSAPKSEDTKTSWPNGQTDRTATAGPEYDRGVALAAALAEVIPVGYESPDDPELNFNQANYDDTVNGTQLWTYMAYAPVAKGDGVGKLIVQVETPRQGNTGEGCALTAKFWNQEGTCTDVVAGGKKVAVVSPEGEIAVEQWAGFRHDDGTVVFVAQQSAAADKPLDGPPLTAEQLAALAVDPRFNID